MLKAEQWLPGNGRETGEPRKKVSSSGTGDRSLLGGGVVAGGPAPDLGGFSEVPRSLNFRSKTARSL